MNYTNQKLKANNLLKEGESSISGTEWLKRAQALSGGLMNDEAFAFYKKKENWHLLPDVDYLFSPDTVFLSPDGRRVVLCFYRRERGWYWYCHCLVSVWVADSLSASLARSPQSSDVSPALEPQSLELPIELVVNGVTYVRK